MMRMRAGMWFVLILIALFALAGWWIWRKRKADSSAHYWKFEYRIPMRDGVKLYTQVYVPKDQSQSWPFLVHRTPFGVAPYGANEYRKTLGPGAGFDKAGYIFVFQDVRGRYQSEGAFVEMRPHIDKPKPGQTDESTDMYDTVEWLLKNVPDNNGRVGIWGMSYAGFYTAASIIDSHPAIKAASPQAPMTDLFRGDDAYHNGALMLASEFLIYSAYFKPRADGPEFPSPDLGRFNYGTEDGYGFFLRSGPAVKDLATLIRNPYFDANVQHNTYDEYWQARDISRHLHGIHCAVLNVAGWFDAEDLAGPLRTWRAIGEQNPDIDNFLVAGPWGHGDWYKRDIDAMGPMKFGANTSDFFRDRVALPFFEHYLKDKPAPDLPKAWVFETGTNEWVRMDTWPPKDAQEQALYLRAGGKLSWDAPAKGEAEFDEYVSDPKNPVPYVESPPTDVDETYMYGDQRFAAKRKDVLTYVSDPLTQDVTVAGPVGARLQVSTSGTDADFDVKLIDVYPQGGEHGGEQGGYAQLVRGEPMRARFRNSFTKPEPMKPEKVTEVNFEMPDVNHTFLRGHRIMVQVQSSWFPLTDLNPQKFVNTATAGAEDFVTATQRVYHSPKAESKLVVRILGRK